MNEKIIKKANIKFNILFKKYDKFINVILDDWRGFRFIYDTEDVRKCKNDCKNCELYKLLKNERPGYFTLGLKKATDKDKELFGYQNYLNCKTIEQYKNCYVNFLMKEQLSKDEIKEELRLIKGLKIIYSKDNDLDKKAKKFKKDIYLRIPNFLV